MSLLETSPSSALAHGLEILRAEIEGLENLASKFDSSFTIAIELILANPKARLVIIGMGKSGYIAGKIAATLASTGSPAFAVHPSDLLHGDFGMIIEGDILIIISHSGETGEVKSILPSIKRRGLKLIAICAKADSTLAAHADILLNTHVTKEACQHNLAPTTSTTVSLALGDALAITLMRLRGFTPEDFALLHPGGSLGKKLLKVRDLMRAGAEAVPSIEAGLSYSGVLQSIDKHKLGFAAVLDTDQKLLGLITDGDLRRAQLKHSEACFSLKASEVMTSSPQTIKAGSLVEEAIKIMETRRISILLVTDLEGKLEGLLDLKDLLKAGLL